MEAVTCFLARSYSMTSIVMMLLFVALGFSLDGGCWKLDNTFHDMSPALAGSTCSHKCFTATVSLP